MTLIFLVINNSKQLFCLATFTLKNADFGKRALLCEHSRVGYVFIYYTFTINANVFL